MSATTVDKSDVRIQLLRSAVTGARWYLVLDAAQDDSAPTRAVQARLPTQSLYAGEFGAQLDHVAPYLVSFELRDVFAEWFFSRWGGNLGIVLQSKAPFDEVRKHLRRYLLVKNESGKKYRFRFYDPRALRTFLPTCTATEVAEFFGPVVRYYAEGKGGEQVLEFGMGPRGMIIRHHPVEKPRPSQTGSDARVAPSRPETGNLSLVLYDAENGVALSGASVQITGPVTMQAVSGAGGLVKFSRIDVGEYEVYAIDGQYRMGTARVSVGLAPTAIRLACQSQASDIGAK